MRRWGLVRGEHKWCGPGRADRSHGAWDTDGPNWVDNTNWLTDAPLGEWYGVSTNGAGRVVRIDLTGPWDNEAQRSIPHGLRGELPAELANLTELTSLRLMNNDLSGAIPPELGNLAKLRELRLDQNELAGVIPPELGGLSNLSGCPSAGTPSRARSRRNWATSLSSGSCALTRANWLAPFRRSWAACRIWSGCPSARTPSRARSRRNWAIWPKLEVLSSARTPLRARSRRNWAIWPSWSRWAS